MTKYFAFFLLSLTFHVQANVEAVINEETKTPSVTMVTTTSGRLITENKAGSKNSEHEVYVPVDEGTGVADSFSIFGNRLSQSTFSNVLADRTNLGNEYIQIQVKHDLGQTGYFQVAIESDDEDEFRVIRIANGSQDGPDRYFVEASSATDTVISLYLADLCTGTGTDPIPRNCDIRSSDNAKIRIYITAVKLKTELKAKSEELAESDDAGVFYEVEFSSDEIAPAAKPIIKDLGIGDTDLKVSYDVSGILNFGTTDFYKAMVVASQVNICEVACATVADLVTGIGSLEKKYKLFGASSGTDQIDGLENNRLYYVQVAPVNKFLFTSKFSADAAETPLFMKEFLTKKQCYLLSASYQTNHPTLEFFRYVRDEVLQHFFLGRTFIHFYYKSAPQYTDRIIKTPWMQETIKSFASLGEFILIGKFQ